MRQAGEKLEPSVSDPPSRDNRAQSQWKYLNEDYLNFLSFLLEKLR